MSDPDHEDQHDDHHDDHDAGHEGEHGLITRLFGHGHGTAEQTDSALESSARGMRVVALSLGALGLTAIVQLVIALASGSVGLLADTIHNGADALTALPLFVAFRVGTRAPTARYTYGYGRAEDLAGVFIVALIALSALIGAWQSLLRLIAPQPIEHLGWVMVGAIVGFIGNEAVAVFRIREGRRIGSAALEADGYHARSDGLASLAVLVGAVGVLLGFPLADPIVGILISVLIVLVLKSAATDIYHRLMDAIDPGLVSQAEAALASVDGVEAIVSTRIRWVGHALWAEIRLVMDCELNLSEAHRIAEDARHAVLHAVPKLAEVIVHPDPCGHGGEDHHASAAHHRGAWVSEPGAET
ncbi:MAG TPA: cation diffusion facilitator family transporter [Candidatus Limnocylindria bacterium]|jgi:cation diffusion facilitator family transporter